MANAKDPIKVITVAHHSSPETAVTEDTWTARRADAEVEPGHACRVSRVTVSVDGVICVTFAKHSNTEITIAHDSSLVSAVSMDPHPTNANTEHTWTGRRIGFGVKPTHALGIV